MLAVDWTPYGAYITAFLEHMHESQCIGSWEYIELVSPWRWSHNDCLRLGLGWAQRFYYRMTFVLVSVSLRLTWALARSHGTSKFALFPNFAFFWLSDFVVRLRNVGSTYRRKTERRRYGELGRSGGFLISNRARKFHWVRQLCKSMFFDVWKLKIMVHSREPKRIHVWTLWRS